MCSGWVMEGVRAAKTNARFLSGSLFRHVAVMSPFTRRGRLLELFLGKR
ncbi:MULTISPECIES: hypothetical protein [unclassified Marinovum]